MEKRLKLGINELNNAVLGGTILGGGGGGNPKKGVELGKIAIEHSDLYLVDINEVSDDSFLLTASLVGAPNAPEQYALPEHYAKTVELFRHNSDVNIGGIITNENGGEATVNGWLQASLTGLPLVDAPCNGRAHPTAVMGGMMLHTQNNFVTTQCFAGGNPKTGRYIEGVIKGSIEHTSAIVRRASIEAGGMVTVARNPITVAYAKKNAAIGGISHAIEVGEVYAEGLEVSPDAAMEALCKLLKGRVIARGNVDEFTIKGEGGFDVGRVAVDGWEITFWNEYMTVDNGKERVATFPDLIMTFDAKTGQPLTSAMIKKDIEVVVFATSKENLRLSTTMADKELIAGCESIVGKELVEYVF